MSQITVPAGFGPLPSVFQGAGPAVNKELSDGIAQGFGVVSFRGKVWRIKFKGEEHDLMRTLPDGSKETRQSIEVVLVAAAGNLSKIYYKDGYQEGSQEKPDCFSTTGIAPDISSPNRQANICATCPHNAWGSRVSQATGKAGKACADTKRVAVIPIGDGDGLSAAVAMFGGPLLLRVPAASLQEISSYGATMERAGYPYFAVATRIGFDPKEAFPKLKFTAIRALSEEEAAVVKEMRESDVTDRILSEALEEASAAEPQKPLFEQPPAVNTSGGNVANPAAQQAQPQPQPQPQPAQQAPVLRQRRARTTTEAPAHAPQEAQVAPKVEPKVEPAPTNPAQEQPAPPPGYIWEFDANNNIVGVKLLPQQAAAQAQTAALNNLPQGPGSAPQKEGIEDAEFQELKDTKTPEDFTAKLKALGL